MDQVERQPDLRTFPQRVVRATRDRQACATIFTLTSIRTLAMPLTLKIDGPYEVPRTGLPGGWVIEREDIALFWEQCPDLASERGCYVFAIRAGRDPLPLYVGKATRSFRQEVFQPHKLVKYHHCMARTLRGTPLLFFVVAQRSRGKVNARAIADCEFELINRCWWTNPDLANERGLGGPSFVIPHVTENTRGRPSHATMDFRAMLWGSEAPRVKIEVVNQAPHLVSVKPASANGDPSRRPIDSETPPATLQAGGGVNRLRKNAVH